MPILPTTVLILLSFIVEKGEKMVSTHDVYCCNCGTQLAWWSGYGDNIQYKEEWECNNEKIRRKVKNCFKTNKKGEEVSVKYENFYCSISNKSLYCRKCAHILHFKCKNCRKGHIKLSRKESEHFLSGKLTNRR